MPNKLVTNSGADNIGTFFFADNFRNSAQMSKLKQANAEKCATLSKPSIMPKMGNGGCEDSIKSPVIKHRVSRSINRLDLDTIIKLCFVC